ncbi:MAG: phytanoyl-CoA dioxygenase family protein [Alphaproteobacteria bacterium]|nr:phytanoyl-CoA dioxygenase family protein [Alphaproteobacteria bacterium]
MGTSIRKATLPLTAEDAEFFAEFGFIYVRDFYPAELFDRLLRELHELIGLVCEREGIGQPRPQFAASEFDAGLALLLKRDRKLGGIVYEAAKKVPSHIQLVGHEVHTAACRSLLNARFPGFASRGWGLRLDHPAEEVYLTQLHQDFVSQLCSLRGLVFWTPLRRADAQLGPVVLYPGSHRHGVFPIQVKGSGSYGLRIHDEAQVERRFEPCCPEVDVGDCVIIDSLLLHKSSPNRSTRTRWALITRYFDFLEPVGQSIGWIGGLQEGHPFDKVFPDKVRE